MFNPLIDELNAICRLLALLGDHHILDVSRTGVKENKNWALQMHNEWA
jgi:hypothetical protein